MALLACAQAHLFDFFLKCFGIVSLGIGIWAAVSDYLLYRFV